MAKVEIDAVDRLLDEIRDLSESDMTKLLKFVHFFKQELLKPTGQEDKDAQLFWQSYGSWKDERPAEDIILDLYESRRSSARNVEL